MMKHQFVIIGGGVHGCAAAWMLADSGEDVLLLEADEVAAGASGGFGRRGVRGNRRDLRELPLMRASYRLWPALADQLGADTYYERTGGLNLIEQETTGTKGGLVAAEAHAAVQSRNGVPTEVLTRDRLLELEPNLGHAVRGALYCPFDGTADHGATTAAFAAAARARGAVIEEHSPVTGVETAAGRVTAVTTAGERRYEVGQALLVLANAGAVDLLRDHFGVTLPVWRILPQALRVRAGAEPPMHHLIGHDHRSLSLKPLPDGGVMVSGGWRGRWNAELGRGEEIDANVRGNLRAAAEVYADLADAELDFADARRPESCSADEIPVIDRVPGTANALVGTGWTGHGFAIAPAVAEALAFWARTGARPESLSPFSATRF
ncbi:NAD(P)/FAD-dependent oxidoreductase [Streptomonospora litoralis]|uniref:4-methylaminobutanoate oxidase (Formaldehyde-forming) n=1 Tax=Streptomonospora litoralis TaxID=2498135 RepID=A0A4P6Q0N2_9ACTN|nr:FAD-binding oxidoreductase [Streptomonospora litoralis]QBI54045.1 4-methylaminobutanoate oxidase (formaldehyde-forming) [Streptomonospora litoralis]